MGDMDEVVRVCVQREPSQQMYGRDFWSTVCGCDVDRIPFNRMPDVDGLSARRRLLLLLHVTSLTCIGNRTSVVGNHFLWLGVRMAASRRRRRH
jgi:hypothetical protein